MINIVFIYLCFWVFISSCFIRWVVSLNFPPDEIPIYHKQSENQLIDKEFNLHRYDDDHWIKNYGVTHDVFMSMPKYIRNELKRRKFDSELERLTNKKTHSKKWVQPHN